MSDDGERTCPLCAEEMDLTDQQLKPCKCGYEICVWCWHHIIDMAEKDDTEGRCPACRTPYDKERIVGMTANCERVVSEVNAERKQKTQKAKPKTSVEARKHLNSVRVIQRNLVYIIGLPLSLADESLLERREYFGQYGRVLKVSISRPTGGAQQTSSSNIFSVYITYAKEEEAVRCIQAVHNFVLDGKPLRACFGTTKYCRAWLRNMSCNNPDCLYLHDVGCQEDSFTKDEIISAYTRSRVPAVASSNMHRRTGFVLPPPADDFCSTVSASASKIAIKGPLNTSVSQAKGSPPDVGGSGRSAVLPAGASWGLRANSQQPSTKQKPEVLINSSGPSVSATTSAWHDDVVSTQKMAEERTTHLDGRCRPLESTRSASRDYKMGLSISSADLTQVRSSAWYDDDITSATSATTRIGGGSGLGEPSKSTRKDSFVALSNSSLGDSFTKHASAWYDDELSDVNMPEKGHATQVSSQSRPSDLSDQLPSKDTHSSSLIDVVHAKETSAWDDDIVTTSTVSEGNRGVSLKQNLVQALESCFAGDAHTSVQDLSAEIAASSASLSGTLIGHSSKLVVQEEVDRKNVGPSNVNTSNHVYSEDHDQLSHGISASKADRSRTIVNENLQNLSSQLSILNLDKHSGVSLPNMVVHNSVSNDLGGFLKPAAGLEHLYADNGIGGSSLASSIGDTSGLQDVPVSMGSSDWPLEPQRQANLGHAPSTIVTQPMYLPYSTGSLLLSGSHTDARGAHAFVDVSSQTSMVKINETPHMSRGDNLLSNGHVGSKFGYLEEAGKSLLCHDSDPARDNMNYVGRSSDSSNVGRNVSANMGESTIISNILTMDFDPWDESLVSGKTFTKLLNEADEQSGSLKMTNLWKGQSNQQSRFSFARQESPTSFSKPLFGEIAHAHVNGPVLQDSLGSHVLRNGFSAGSCEDHMALNSSGHSVISTDRSAVLSRAKTSAPPGFSVPNRLQAPPHGFSSQERFDQTYDTTNSENRMFGGSSLRSDYQMPGPGSISDVEFIDPAILAVGKGRLPHVEDNSGFDLRYTFPLQFSSSEIDPRIQLLMQQPVSAHQDLRVTDNFGARFLPQNDSYIPSRNVHENLPSLSPFGLMSLQSRNSQWEGWNNIHASNEAGLNEILRNKRLGHNRYFPGNEEEFPTGDIYNRGFGI